MYQMLPALGALYALALFAQAPPDQNKAAEKKPEAPKEKTFEEIIKGARQISGLFTTYRTDEEKVYLELRPEQLEKI